jgi:hypothetical protein
MSGSHLIYLSIVSFLAWIVSTLAGGGSPFVLMPMVNLLMGAESVPPVITVGMFMGNSHRVFLFWRHINWELTLWYLPGAITGAVLGAYTFTKVHLEWLQLIIGIFLIVSAILFALEKRPANKHSLIEVAGSAAEDSTDESIALSIADPIVISINNPPNNPPNNTFDRQTIIPDPKPSFWTLQAWHILPAGFLKAFVSGLVGTTGPVLNPFYLRYGLVKEQLIATKAAHMAIIHLVKIATYGVFAALSQTEIIAGLAIGLAAIPANLVGKVLIDRLSADQFRQIVLAFMTLGGIWMIVGQLQRFTVS